MKIGVIAEHHNDVEVLYAIIGKLVEQPHYSIKRWIGNGCGKIRKNCAAWADDLRRKGCHLLIVCHDLDDRDAEKLRAELEGKIESVEFDGRLVVLPTREIEAWLLTDAQAIKETFNLQGLPNVPHAPEQIEDPKKELQTLAWTSGKKRYANTIHNKKIAEEIGLEKLAKCPSFTPLLEFVQEKFGVAA